jgi:hypothetical protein
MLSGNLNFLEPSGPLQACNGNALPLPFTYSIYSEPNIGGKIGRREFERPGYRE